MSRAGNWPGGLRWIVRRVKPSRRQMRNLTAYEKKTGWRYSITCTNIPDAGIGGVPGSHHPQYIDVVHREHAGRGDRRRPHRESHGPAQPASKTWQVNCGWVIAANIAADLAAWTRLLGHRDDPELRDADPDTLRYRIWHIPARLARHARQRTLEDQPRLAVDGGVPDLLAAALRPARTRLTSTDHPSDTKGGPPRRGRSRCAPGHTGHHRAPPHQEQTDTTLETGRQHNQ